MPNLNNGVPVSEMLNIRIFYTKMERAKYISHLDITRCMQRCIKRAGLPVWYTEGFNPHIYLTFALPLTLGYESETESMDLRLVEAMDFDELKENLNGSLPHDIRVTKVALQKNKPSVIEKALYTVTIGFTDDDDNHSGKLLNDCLQNLISEDKIEVVKKSKKGSKTIDIKPDIEIIDVAVSKRSIAIEMTAAAGLIKNINPSLLTDEMIGKYNLKDIHVAVIRRKVYDSDGNLFE